MTYFPLPDEFYADPRFFSASADAVALWARAASWSAHHLTDGHVPSSALPLLRQLDEQFAAELVALGVWKRARGGFRFVDWPRLASRAYVEAKREADRARQQKRRTSRAMPSRRDSRASRTRVSGESRRESRPPIQSSPLQSPQEKTTPDGVGGASPPTEINAGAVVAAWVEAFQANDAAPTAGMRAQVGRTARELLSAGNAPDKVLEAARVAGAKGFTTIDRELGALSGRRARDTGDERGRWFEQ
ncbi:hypothetical protein GCM10012275_39500 [Longimycelium tulufanense]|uniref:DUF1376 domain-containing protein n=1 Tax=Longimycelium tulufanense TaxID=907463 RepID=A0A8J3CAH8_9PSEU|nr:hypothetical protein [Longimycelium tulufanense]GGM65048.1 hypothetical protein GCM10012275_39500 [Longimycelium tulufanense]